MGCLDKIGLGGPCKMLKTKMLNNVKFQAGLLDRIAMPWFLSTVFGAYYMSMTYVFPVLYWDQTLSFLNSAMINFIVVEIMVNWLCLCFVKSDFTIDKYEQNKHLKFGEQVGTTDIKRIIPVRREMHDGKIANVWGVQNDNATNPEAFLNPLEQPATTKNDRHVVVLPNIGGDPNSSKRTLYPYWSWKPCVMCQIERPPRATHCPLCKKCILKRDHHCFFARNCIHLRNQRHFIVFTFWTFFATLYALYCSCLYIYFYILEHYSRWDLLLPVTIVRWLLDYTDSFMLVCAMVLYSIIFFCPLAGMFFKEQLHLSRNGLVDFEVENHIKIYNDRTVEQNLHGVFGPYWFVNFLIPLHWLYEPGDSGIEWHGIDASRKQ